MDLSLAPRSEDRLESEENASDTLMTLLVKDQSLLTNSEVAPWSWN